jgi:hypothetical protein
LAVSLPIIPMKGTQDGRVLGKNVRRYGKGE